MDVADMDDTTGVSRDLSRELGQAGSGHRGKYAGVDHSSETDSDVDEAGEMEIGVEGFGEEGSGIRLPWGEEEERIWTWQPPEIMAEEMEEEIEQEVLKGWVCGQDWSKSTIGDLTEPTVSVSVERHGMIKDPLTGADIKIHKFTLSDNIISVSIIDFGATVISVTTPDREGVLDDILLGFDTTDDYVGCGCLNFGSTLGRTTGVIRKAEFYMKDKSYYLRVNYGRHHKHGGCQGFGQVMWKAYVKNDRVVMTYISKAGEEGYPGSVFVQRTFIIPGDGSLVVETQARVSLPTPLGVSSMLYFNLGGHLAGEKAMMEHILQINGDYVLEVDEEDVPTGRLISVADTNYDLRSPRILRRAFTRMPDYNTTFCLRSVSKGVTRFALRTVHPETGRFLEIETDYPALYINSCGRFPGSEPRPPPVKHYPFFSSYQDVAYNKDIYTDTSSIHGSMICPDWDVKPKPIPMPNGDPVNEVTTKGTFWLTPTAKKDVLGEIETECPPKAKESNEQSEIEEEGEKCGEDSDIVLGIPGKGGAMYRRRCALAVFPCEYPDSVNHSNFPSVFIRPTRMYTRVVTYRFGVVHQRPVETQVVTEKVCPPTVPSSEGSMEGVDEESFCERKPSDMSMAKVIDPDIDRVSIPSSLPLHGVCRGHSESYKPDNSTIVSQQIDERELDEMSANSLDQIAQR